MLLRKMALSLTLLAPVTALGAGLGNPEVGKPAPNFSLPGYPLGAAPEKPKTSGKAPASSYELANLLKDNAKEKKYIVLEWWNEGCPYVKKHYDSGNMQELQTFAKEKGAVWLTVLSSAEGKQGYMEGPKAVETLNSKKAAPAAVLLDPEGTVGKLYGATTTPHMFIIDPKGTLIYKGAIDNKPTTDQADIKSADTKNYVRLALNAATSGQAIQDTSTKPYGCSVKYK